MREWGEEIVQLHVWVIKMRRGPPYLPCKAVGLLHYRGKLLHKVGTHNNQATACS